MQFGRIHGIGLAVLGALLLAFQTMLVQFYFGHVRKNAADSYWFPR
jgi:hypothetical protein